MDTKTALGAAGGISLTVAGAVSALVLTLGGGTASSEPAPASNSVIEYVDQYGNPVSLEQQGPSVPEIVVTSEVPQGGADADMTAASDVGEGAYEEHDEAAEYDEYADHEEDEEEDDD